MFEQYDEYFASLGYTLLNSKNGRAVTRENYIRQIPLRSTTDIPAIPPGKIIQPSGGAIAPPPDATVSTIDLGATCFIFIAMYALQRFLHRPSWVYLIGVALGLALAVCRREFHPQLLPYFDTQWGAILQIGFKSLSKWDIIWPHFAPMIGPNVSSPTDC